MKQQKKSTILKGITRAELYDILYPLKIFSIQQNIHLGIEAAEAAGTCLSNANQRRFSDHEFWARYEDSIRESDTYIIFSTNQPDGNYTEGKLMIDAARRASAHRITAVIPYLGYQRKERKKQSRVPISAKAMLRGL